MLTFKAFKLFLKKNLLLCIQAKKIFNQFNCIYLRCPWHPHCTLFKCQRNSWYFIWLKQKKIRQLSVYVILFTSNIVENFHRWNTQCGFRAVPFGEVFYPQLCSLKWKTGNRKGMMECTISHTILGYWIFDSNMAT